MIAALFVKRDGPYYGLPDVDPWDEERDARLYEGPWPVVAHPPCARWCLLAGLVEARGGPKKGEDGGTFESALRSVRSWGGVLEHPAQSRAWHEFGLPVPATGAWQRGVCGGWSRQVDQGHYGHPARKATWLYAFGVSLLPAMPSVPATVSGKVELMSSDGVRSKTPLAFRDLLLDMARSVEDTDA